MAALYLMQGDATCALTHSTSAITLNPACVNSDIAILRVLLGRQSRYEHSAYPLHKPLNIQTETRVKHSYNSQDVVIFY